MMSFAAGTGLTYQMKSAISAAMGGWYTQFIIMMASTGFLACKGMHMLSVQMMAPSFGRASFSSGKPSPPMLFGAAAMKTSPDQAWVMMVSWFSSLSM